MDFSVVSRGGEVHDPGAFASGRRVKAQELAVAVGRGVELQENRGSGGGSGGGSGLVGGIVDFVEDHVVRSEDGRGSRGAALVKCALEECCWQGGGASGENGHGGENARDFSHFVGVFLSLWTRGLKEVLNVRYEARYDWKVSTGC